MATGRPVLALTNPAGDAGQIIHDVGGGVAVPADDPGVLREVIADACRKRRLDTPPQNRAALAAFERPNRTERLALLLERATNRMPSRAGSTGVAPVEPAVLR